MQQAGWHLLHDPVPTDAPHQYTPDPERDRGLYSSTHTTVTRIHQRDGSTLNPAIAVLPTVLPDSQIPDACWGLHAGSGSGPIHTTTGAPATRRGTKWRPPSC